MQHYDFDEQNLREIGLKYRTFVIMTDYVRRVEVYKGPLDESCFDMVNFYLDNGWLDNCVWTKQETLLKGGWKRLTMEALDSKKEEMFNITIKIKDKILPVKEIAGVKLTNSNMFLIGLVSAFFPLEKILEVLGIGWLLSKVTNKK